MPSVHLLVLVHGMWGNTHHLAEMASKIRGVYESVTKSDFHLLVSETNVEDYTYDGIDHGGERVAEEIFNEIEMLRKEHRTVDRFSITGYSFGGLVSRYVIGILYQRKFFDDVAPANFNTFATPHIGLPRYPNFISALANSLGPTFLSRSGEQMFVMDKWSSTGRPLLAVMADPNRVFYMALDLFPHITIYANSIHDRTVPYVTAAIELEDPFLDHRSNGIEVTLHEEYSDLIKSYRLPTDGFARPAAVKHKLPLLPVSFPHNMMTYMSLPVLVPAALGVILIRASLASHSSRRRIRLLEKDASHSSNLANIVAELENEMDEQVVELEHDGMTVESSTVSEDNWRKPCSRKPGEDNGHSKFCNCKRKHSSAENSNNNASSSSSSLHTSASENGSDKLVIRLRHGWRKSSSSADHSVSRSCSPAPSSHESADEPTESNFPKHSRKNRKSSASSHPAPVLSNLQKDMIVSLNKLPNLRKERTYYDTIKNAHAAIVCRDDGLFTERRISAGDGALRHWADNFVF